MGRILKRPRPQSPTRPRPHRSNRQQRRAGDRPGVHRIRCAPARSGRVRLRRVPLFRRTPAEAAHFQPVGPARAPHGAPCIRTARAGLRGHQLFPGQPAHLLAEETARRSPRRRLNYACRARCGGPGYTEKGPKKGLFGPEILKSEGGESRALVRLVWLYVEQLMRLIWVVAILECSNLEPSLCKPVVLSPVGTEAECRSIVGSVNYELPNRAQGTFVRPECREYPETHQWGRQATPVAAVSAPAEHE